ncbi:hypothetical protein VNO77_02548 [Canavalia gladiata]|uniref:Uncharacterized protein n=1 Tax=Canavalia gladiata TaxID=3824 RepID=A0AAN9RBD9_CANGL
MAGGRFGIMGFGTVLALMEIARGKLCFALDNRVRCIHGDFGVRGWPLDLIGYYAPTVSWRLLNIRGKLQRLLAHGILERGSIQQHHVFMHMSVRAYTFFSHVLSGWVFTLLNLHDCSFCFYLMLAHGYLLANLWEEMRTRPKWLSKGNIRHASCRVFAPR